MPKINSNASDKQGDAMTTTNSVMTNVVISTDPVIITAVQRKVNIGNYETTINTFIKAFVDKRFVYDRECAHMGRSERWRQQKDFLSLHDQ